MLIPPCSAPPRGGERMIVTGRPTAPPPVISPSSTIRLLFIELLREATRRDPAARVHVWSSLTVKVAGTVTGPEPVWSSEPETVPCHTPTSERPISAGNAEALGGSDSFGPAHLAISTKRLATKVAR